MHTTNSKIYLITLPKSELSKVLIWKNDVNLARLLVASEQPVSIENVKIWYESTTADPNQVLLGIYNFVNKSLIGIARLMFIDYQHKTAEIGLYLGDESIRGRGFGKSSVNELIQHAFLGMGLERLYLRVLDSNKAAQRCYLSCGFKQEGIYRKHVLINGERKDMLLMGLLREEYQNLS